MRNPTCSNCGGPAILGELSVEEQQIRIENARLRDELDRVRSLASKFLGQPVSGLSPHSVPNSSLELAVGSNGFGSMDYFNRLSSSSMGSIVTPSYKPMSNLGGVDNSGLDKSVLVELALSAMDELVKMAQLHEPLWIRTFDSRKETLNFEEYLQTFPRCIGVKPVEFVSEATRETGMVIFNSFALVETLMDATRWADMFPGMIAKATTTDIISSGVGGSRNGALQLMKAELQVLSPLVPTRDINFLRFCKQLAERAWAVVDVSIDAIRENLSGNIKCRRLPSGCVVQDMPNGYSQDILLLDIPVSAGYSKLVFYVNIPVFNKR